jgi:hypothetical protein
MKSGYQNINEIEPTDDSMPSARQQITCFRIQEGGEQPSESLSESLPNIKKRKPCADVRVDTPAAFDVLCGRGKPFQEHQGNKRMRQIVNELKERYQCVPRNRKVLVAEEVIGRIKEKGGRFLKLSGRDYWVEVSHPTSLEKVSHSFRTLKRDTAKKANRRAHNQAVGQQSGREVSPNMFTPINSVSSSGVITSPLLHALARKHHPAARSAVALPFSSSQLRLLAAIQGEQELCIFAARQAYGGFMNVPDSSLYTDPNRLVHSKTIESFVCNKMRATAALLALQATGQGIHL